MELIKVSNNGVSAKELYDYLFGGLEKVTPFNKWISRRIYDYGFKENEDFQTFLSESTGGRKLKDYALSIDMAKELCMVERTEKGRKARKYFLKCEKIARRTEAIRLAGIEARKTLTDKIKESKENERMHGHAYSKYTLLAYNLCGIKYEKNKSFRDNLMQDQLERVKTVESMICGMLEMKYQYLQIKEMLSPIISKKEIAND